MNDIQFEESKYGNKQNFVLQENGFGDKLISFVFRISGGIFKNKQQVAILIGILSLVATVIGLYGIFRGDSEYDMDDQNVAQIEIMEK